jgi:flagellar assembly protein FliH
MASSNPLYRSEAAMSREAGVPFEVFRYPTGPQPDPAPPLWIGMSALDSEPVIAAPASVEIPETSKCGREREEIDADLRQQFETGRQQGYDEGRKVEHELQSAMLLEEERRRKEQLGELIQKFAAERDRYLHEVEHEVVELALAVAARILRRESQMDPLLLTGAVRVALGQLSKTTKVRLQVPVSELDLWADAIAHIPNLPLKPDVLAGEGLHVGDCLIETEMGSVDLGIRAQFGEIERGFFDRPCRTNTVADALHCEGDSVDSGIVS